MLFFNLTSLERDRNLVIKPIKQGVPWDHSLTELVSVFSKNRQRTREAFEIQMLHM